MMPLDEFGQALLDARDLDPVYDVLHAADLRGDSLRRWLMAYWCCYSAGEASWISEQPDFWTRMLEMAANETVSPAGGRWPRGRERRYFRGQKSVDAVRWLMGRYPNPEDAVQWLEVPGPFRVIKERVITWPLFGPWIAFKIGDMLERLARVRVDFTGTDVFFFDSPRLAAEQWYGSNKPAAITESCAFLSSRLGHNLAPPSFDRLLGLQEYETILCKWGAHMNDRYPIGIDTRELKEALHPWCPVSPTAKRLSQALP